jgi:hypothetical protein
MINDDDNKNVIVMKMLKKQAVIDNNKSKATVALFITKYHAMKTYGGMKL